jgi:hypothetical protein
MWDESALSVLTDEMLHSYTEYCPCVTLDYYAMKTACGIAHIPYGAEILYRTVTQIDGRTALRRFRGSRSLVP